jgi:hypothetical protein
MKFGGKVKLEYERSRLLWDVVGTSVNTSIYDNFILLACERVLRLIMCGWANDECSTEDEASVVTDDAETTVVDDCCRDCINEDDEDDDDEDDDDVVTVVVALTHAGMRQLQRNWYEAV